MLRLKKLINESIVGKTVTIVNLDDASQKDWDMNNVEWKKLQSYEGKKAKVKSIAVENDTGDEADDYYNVVFQDGYSIDALSGYHIKELL